MKEFLKNTSKLAIATAFLLLSTLAIANNPKDTTPLNTATTDITIVDADGNKIKLSSLKGKVLFVNFWATWCPPCIKEMPSIQSLKEKFKKEDIAFIMIDVDGDHNKAQSFMDRKQYNLPVYIPGGAVSPNYLGNSVPTTLIFDKKGNLVQRIVGGVDYDSEEVEKFMKAVIKL
ncbi:MULTISPECIES: TlpA family protein disulfide reductase [Myroides]|uniref:Redoxin domain-containing protein n=1 Tax=Myroides albus TaxID=2562892 RepID=A0A6I3LS96_9FLAO|nr:MULTISPECIES: TlpA disulfide reductase family protein [Myroides]MTG98972.1 redoxin domain-containing protein [Myroides albus]MVX37332.1 redoxin domain-containing protein [Myroides sp. LoEW2-1]UVD80233.1 TlpA family protein disulfide reductase [Myroides albus]